MRINSKGIIIFGCGNDGILTKEILEVCGYSVDFFCDSAPKKVKMKIENISVLSLESVRLMYKDYLIVIGSRKYADEMYDMLRKIDFPADHILQPIYGLIWGKTSRQYFDVLSIGEEEVFVDAGSFDGNTIANFMDCCERKYKSIIAFEPIEKQFKYIKQRCEKECWKNIKVYNYGVWDKNEKLSFLENNSASRIDREGKIQIEGVKLDDFIKKEVTFIKMDIEGAELRALSGAADIIRKYRPKLAICVYHKLEDIVEIPLKIIDIEPEYKFYIRHYSTNDWETVLYAVCD